MRILRFLLAPWALFLIGPFVADQVAMAASAENTLQLASDDCERLAVLDLPDARITMAKVVPAGTFGPPQPSAPTNVSASYKGLPAFCRIVAHARPTADSDIVVEVWLPLAGWNGKLLGLSNGGFAGQINYPALGAAMAKGYVATATDTGHSDSTSDAAWALGHPEKVIDFGYRGIHEMTRVAKLVVLQYFGSAPRHSYFTGCSDGGREALMEAQRYPYDYNGILAGDPANYMTGLLSLAVVDTKTLTETPASFIPQEKIPTIANAVLAACDKLDGLADGILNDPRQCHFDPASIECQAGEDTHKCLTAPQVASLKRIYAGIQDSHGRTIFPGYLPGAEDGDGGWEIWITGLAPAKSLLALFGIGYFSYMVYDNPGWNYSSFSLESGMQAAREKTASALDAVNPDLSAFRAHGGKLILYHGWDDPAVPANNTVNYYESVVAKMGRANTDSFVRLYMVPGMHHCGGGPGADTFGQSVSSTAEDPQHNVRVALEDWVVNGTAPGTLTASKTAKDAAQGSPILTRPLCPYPQFARYKGSGDSNRAENFVCLSPK